MWSDMDTSQFEQIISTFKLKFLWNKEGAAENRKLPSFLDTLNSYIQMTNGIPPDQETFIETYFWNNDVEWTTGIEARARRAYASLIREHHLGLLLREHFTVLDDDAIRDQMDGIDYVIQHNNQLFYLHAFVDTERSNYFRAKKDSRRPTISGGTHLDIKMDPKSAKTCGMFWVYDLRHIENLKRQMNMVEA